MIDLHTHTIFSDGVLIPAELLRRAKVAGYRAIALTDHVDMSNLDHVLPRVLAAVKELNRHQDVVALAGVELTHLPLELIAPMTRRARELGAQIVVGHGESLAEPVLAGSNRAAIEAGVDILAHPGLLSPQEAELAARQGVLLEITSRRGHCLGNGNTVRRALAAGASMVLCTDAHAPGDLIDRRQAERVALGAGLPAEHLPALWQASRELVARAAQVAI